MKKSLGPRTILHPHPVLIVGSYDEDGKPNMMAASWAGICCSKPPCLMVALRKATKTYHNIMHSKAYTASIPSTRFVEQADYVGVVSGKDTDKFAATGLTPIKSELVSAPYVGEYPLVLECKLVHTFELGLHTQFVGEILDVKAEPEVLGDNGLPDIEKVQPFAYATGNRAYYAMGEHLQAAFVTKELTKQKPVET